MDAQDLSENTQTLTVGTQLGVDINFSSVELTLSLDDFADRILHPAMARLAAEVDKTVITACYPDVWNFVYGTLGTQPTIADVLSARAKLAQSLTLRGRRSSCVILWPPMRSWPRRQSYFHSGSQIEKQYEQGLVGSLCMGSNSMRRK